MPTTKERDAMGYHLMDSIVGAGLFGVLVIQQKRDSLNRQEGDRPILYVKANAERMKMIRGDQTVARYILRVLTSLMATPCKDVSDFSTSARDGPNPNRLVVLASQSHRERVPSSR